MSWLEVLREACEESSQVIIGKRLGYSKTTVSQVLGGKYTGDVARFQESVEAVLMKRTVNCPVLGDIALSVCLSHQKRKFSTTNPMRVQMYRACRAQCQHSKVQEQ